MLGTKKVTRDTKVLGMLLEILAQRRVIIVVAGKENVSLLGREMLG